MGPDLSDTSTIVVNAKSAEIPPNLGLYGGTPRAERRCCQSSGLVRPLCPRGSAHEWSERLFERNFGLIDQRPEPKERELLNLNGTNRSQVTRLALLRIEIRRHPLPFFACSTR